MRANRKQEAIIYWLLPAKDERELFCEIIRILCKQFDTPNFEPHLTLLSTAVDREARNNRELPRPARSPKMILQSIDSGPIHVDIRGVAFSADFSKTLFVRFEPNKALHNLVAELGRAGNIRASSIRDPHVSLLYGRISSMVKKELAATIKLPFREVVFDKIAAVRSAAPIKTGLDIEAWAFIASKSLGT